MKRMVDSLMSGHIRECAGIVVCTPLITPDLFGVLLSKG